MLKTTTIASGSKGNCTLVEINGTRILLDCGVPFKFVPPDIYAVFISHMQHSDHFNKTTIKKLACPVYCPAETPDPWESPDYLLADFVRLPQGGFIKAIPADHDVPCVSYIINDDYSKMIYCTDTGTIPCATLPYLMDCNIIHIEANHDITMLLECKDNDDLKLRVNDTHLSNDQTVDILELVKWKGLKHVIAGHLSEGNNSKAIVQRMLELAVGEGCQVHVAPCDTVTVI